MPAYTMILRILTAFLFLMSAASGSNAESAVQFSWAVLTDTATGLRPLDFSAPPKLKTGTTLQIYIEQKPGAFIYLYLIDSTGGLTFVFPGDTEYYNSAKPSDRIFRIPPDTARFELMPPGGQEKLYLLASPARLTGLENLTAAFLGKPDDKDLRAGVIRELKLLRRRHSSLSQKTETSVPVAGTIRSRGGDDGSFEAIHVKADGFYSRILRIDHD
ncbi:MAG TPA: DUF4384 domain-containing protein [Desulfobacteraceae bacterium]|nr:DUF4384 domain-containing protein [Desulfobacteraceae bacterium]